MLQDVTSVAMKSSNRIKIVQVRRKEMKKLQKKLLYSFKLFFQLENKKCRIPHTLIHLNTVPKEELIEQLVPDVTYYHGLYKSDE